MESKLRIPRVATAALVLGGACGEENKPAPLDAKGTDTSPARRHAVAEAVCETLAACEGRPASVVPSCAAGVESYFDDYVAADVTDDCMDALLDYYSCYASLSCEDLDDDESDAFLRCELESRLEQRCEGQLDEGDEAEYEPF